MHFLNLPQDIQAFQSLSRSHTSQQTTVFPVWIHFIHLKTFCSKPRLSNQAIPPTRPFLPGDLATHVCQDLFQNICLPKDLQNYTKQKSPYSLEFSFNLFIMCILLFSTSLFFLFFSSRFIFSDFLPSFLLFQSNTCPSPKDNMCYKKYKDLETCSAMKSCPVRR